MVLVGTLRRKQAARRMMDLALEEIERLEEKPRKEKREQTEDEAALIEAWAEVVQIQMEILD
jgi:hypothetical protein